VQALAPQFQQRLQALGQHPLVGQARGVGLIGALEIVQDKAARRPFDAAAGVAAAIQAAALEQGLIVRAIRDAVAVCPPLIITTAQVDELFDKFSRALDVSLQQARARGLQVNG